MNIISQTVALSANDMFHFMILFFLIFLGFCAMSVILFGSHLSGYADFGRVTQTMAKMITGNIDYASIWSINPLMASIMLWAYVLIIVFVMVNIFLAILIDAYAEAKGASADATSIAGDLSQWANRAVGGKAVAPNPHDDVPLVGAFKHFHALGVDHVGIADVAKYLGDQKHAPNNVVLSQLKLLAALPPFEAEDDKPPGLTMAQMLRNA